MNRNGPQRKRKPDAPPPRAESTEHHHPLDDDIELAHIARYSPPEIDVSPNSVSPGSEHPEQHDSPPPMVKPEEGQADNSRIEHIAPLGPLADRVDDPPEMLKPVEENPGRKIRAFEQKLGGGGHESKWQRKPNVTGTGAIHVKSFHCKLTGDSLEFLDAQINEWLDAHPEYEVKQVTTSVGEWTGKMKEPALIVNVWV